MEDWIARAIAALGLAVSVVGLGLTLFLWRREGPRLKVTAFVRVDGGTVHVEVASVGRIAVTLRQLEIRDHFTMNTSRGGYKTVAVSRWVAPVVTRPELPTELAPTAYVEGDVVAAELIGRAGSSPNVTVAAWAQRGDGKWFASKPLQIR